MKFIYENIGYIFAQLVNFLFVFMFSIHEIIEVYFFNANRYWGHEMGGWAYKTPANYITLMFIYIFSILPFSIYSLFFIKTNKRKAWLLILFSWMILIIIVLIESDISIYDLFLILLI